MRKAVRVLDTYLNGFGLDAYAEDSVPDNIEFPYITYRVVDPEWYQKVTFFIRVWYRSTSNTELLTKSDQIVEDIGIGRMIAFDEGVLVLWPESPVVQVEIDSNDRLIRYAYINLSLNVYSLPGT